MRGPFIFSILFHLAIFLIAWFGIPWPQRDLQMPAPVMQVDVVSEDEIADQKAAPKEKTKVPPPPPPPPAAPPAPPKVEQPKPVEKKAEPKVDKAPDAEPVPALKKVAEKPKKEEPKPPEPKPVKKQPDPVKDSPKIDMPRPKEKPKAPPREDFSQVLRTVQDLKKEAPPPQPEKQDEEKKKEEKKPQTLKDAVAEALKQQAPKQENARRIEGALTMSELDAVRQQIAGCWNVPAGARNAEDLIVEVRIEVNQDMTVRDVRLVHPEKASDPFWRTAAESAVRAVLNPRCSPLKLPPNKYDVWKSIIFTFNPREMLG